MLVDEGVMVMMMDELISLYSMSPIALCVKQGEGERERNRKDRRYRQRTKCASAQEPRKRLDFSINFICHY